MGCSDLLLLQRFVDGELDPPQAEVMADHISACDACRAEARRAAELRAFVQDHLGAEDEGEEEATAFAVAAISHRVLPPRIARPDVMRWWRRTWMASAALAVIALLVPTSFLSTLVASPEDILEEAAERDRIWMYQPNKALHWEVDTVSQGVKRVADGRWRTSFWRRNGASTFAEISRQINPQGQAEFAYWQNADGSSVTYRAKSGTIEITPSTAVARQALADLPPDLRKELESQLTMRALQQSLDVARRRDVERLHGRSVWISGGEATFSRGALDRWGDVHHIRVVKEGLTAEIARAVHEYDIDSSSLRLLRLKSTITYTDGTVGIHDSRWVSHREISETEFAAQSPRELLESRIPVVRLTPADLARQRLQRMNRSASH